MLKAVIELVGPKGVGKTTLLERCVADCCRVGSVLVLDSSPDEGASQQSGWIVTEPLGSVHQVLEELVQQQPPPTPEAIDLAFANLPVSVPIRGAAAPLEADLIRLGPLPAQLSAEAQHWLRYGLGRLLSKGYHYVIVDGYNAWHRSFLPAESRYPVVVLTPALLAVLPRLQILNEDTQPPVLLLNQVSQAHPLPDDLGELIARHAIRLIGKLPLWASPEVRQQELAPLLRNALHHMNLPDLALLLQADEDATLC
ncbi:MAG: hypothetical protein SFZ03_10490 [Candidatus Melainabacteria bacterium]|nr:hypothetical protein [Candidatus Melainabacteria bacterium]